jgi:hypothetical protein
MTTHKLTTKGTSIRLKPDPPNITDVLNEMDKIQATLESILSELQAIRRQAGK